MVGEFAAAPHNEEEETADHEASRHEVAPWISIVAHEEHARQEQIEEAFATDRGKDSEVVIDEFALEKRHNNEQTKQDLVASEGVAHDGRVTSHLFPLA